MSLSITCTYFWRSKVYLCLLVIYTCIRDGVYILIVAVINLEIDWSLMPTVILLAGESWGVERYCRYSIIQSDWEKILQQARIRSLSYIFFLLSDPEDVEYEDVVSVLRGITLTERERVGQVKSQHSFSPRPVAI